MSKGGKKERRNEEKRREAKSINLLNTIFGKWQRGGTIASTFMFISGVILFSSLVYDMILSLEPDVISKLEELAPCLQHVR